MDLTEKQKANMRAAYDDQTRRIKEAEQEILENIRSKGYTGDQLRNIFFGCIGVGPGFFPNRQTKNET